MIRFHRPAFRFVAKCLLLSCLPIIAYGDLVSGTVNPVPSNKEFSIKDSQGKVVKNSVKTDAQGNFQVTLRPGVYSATSDKGTATIQSSKRPLLRQDIKFK